MGSRRGFGGPITAAQPQHLGQSVPVKTALRAVAVVAVAASLIFVVAQAMDEHEAGMWARLWGCLALLALVALPIAVVASARDPMTRIRRVTLAWLALTILLSPVAYGAALLVMVPGLAALVARLYVGPSNVAGRNVTCLFLGPSIAIGLVWFISRVDEVPVEAIPSGAFIVIGVIGLTQLRRRSRRSSIARA